MSVAFQQICDSVLADPLLLVSDIMLTLLEPFGIPVLQESIRCKHVHAGILVDQILLDLVHA